MASAWSSQWSSHIRNATKIFQALSSNWFIVTVNPNPNSFLWFLWVFFPFLFLVSFFLFMDPLLNGVSTVLRLGHTWFGFILGRPLLITLLIRSWTISFGLVIWSRYSLLWHLTWSSPRSRDFLHGYILWLYVARHGFHMHVDIRHSTVPLWTPLFWMAHVAKHDASCFAP